MSKCKTGRTECEVIQEEKLWEKLHRIFQRFLSRFKKKPENNFIKHANREFVAVGYDLNDKEEGPNKWIVENVFELLNVFNKQGHSGSSASYCVNYFKKLALFKSLSPLKGSDDEWNEVAVGRFQNKRCSHVFKGADGKAYDIQGKIFREPNGCCYQNRESRVFIEFPYTPTIEYINVPASDSN